MSSLPDVSARVARRYSGTAGRVENCHRAVPDVLAPAGRTLLDRELHMGL